MKRSFDIKRIVDKGIIKVLNVISEIKVLRQVIISIISDYPQREDDVNHNEEGAIRVYLIVENDDHFNKEPNINKGD